MKQKENIRRSSVQNALELLSIFSLEEPELGISELSRKMGVANSTVHRLVTTLVSEGFIAKDRNTNLYRLGISILALSNIVTSTMEVHKLALPMLHELVKKSNESVHISIFRKDEVIFLNRIDSARSIQSLSISGSHGPAHCTSSGQVFLAFESAETVNRIIKRGLKAYTEKSITDPGQLYAVLKKVRDQGYVISVEEFVEDVTSVAAPIRDCSNQVIATLSIVGPTIRISNTLPQIIKLVLQAADQVSQLYQQKGNH